MSVWPLIIVVVKTKELLPEPDSYKDWTVLLPINKANVGDPTEVLTVMVSLKVRVALSVSPELRVLFSSPVEPLNLTDATAGGRVSNVVLEANPAVPELPAASV